jgi:hypothetical protein
MSPETGLREPLHPFQGVGMAVWPLDIVYCFYKYCATKSRALSWKNDFSSWWAMKNTLYYGDNLDILRKYVPDESVDLIYLDPPFNSKTSYNILFKQPSRRAAEAQIKAFGDEVWI